MLIHTQAIEDKLLPDRGLTASGILPEHVFISGSIRFRLRYPERGRCPTRTRCRRLAARDERGPRAALAYSSR
jgi:hypothetical protein